MFVFLNCEPGIQNIQEFITEPDRHIQNDIHILAYTKQ